MKNEETTPFQFPETVLSVVYSGWAIEVNIFRLNTAWGVSVSADFIPSISPKKLTYSSVVVSNEVKIKGRKGQKGSGRSRFGGSNTEVSVNFHSPQDSPGLLNASCVLNGSALISEQGGGMSGKIEVILHSSFFILNSSFFILHSSLSGGYQNIFTTNQRSGFV